MKLVETKRRITYSASYTKEELEEMCRCANMAYNIASSHVNYLAHPQMRAEAMDRVTVLRAFKDKLILELKQLQDAETVANIP